MILSRRLIKLCHVPCHAAFPLFSQQADTHSLGHYNTTNLAPMRLVAPCRDGEFSSQMYKCAIKKGCGGCRLDASTS
jgi:hypothetical protein